MVHLERVHGQKGHMIIHEDGTIISSSGDLGSNETTSQQVTSLMGHSLPVNFNTNPMEKSTMNMNGSMSGSIPQPDLLVNGPGSVGVGTSRGQNQPKLVKWNRITVNFGNQSYMACLSNRRIHVVKREHDQPNAGAQ